MNLRRWHRSSAFLASRRAIALLTLVMCPAVARADIVWPGVVLEKGLMSLWVIALGLLIEIAFVWWLFRLTLRRAAFVATIANVVSAALGVVLVPIAGLVWAIFPGFLVERLLHIGTFNAFTWTGTFLLAALVSTGIECAVYVRAFKLIARRREFAWLYLANAISTGAALVSVVVNPPQL